MNARELLHHTFPWEQRPGVPKSESVNPAFPGTHKCQGCGEWMYRNDTAKAITGSLVCPAPVAVLHGKRNAFSLHAPAQVQE